ncbi:G patch domain-containing protein 2 [Anthonomus grandis grandis]|uniref:G patch domain-containing protein 2 n=1 Tax=Anthonomus grandis grandis TaxID=2921223 RepID=UPI0021655140|nr:G patch domain-containing protein 2 [Anthonomus grandis grandis]
MDHLAEDLTVALEESESCGPTTSKHPGRWGMRRRTRSAGNLHQFYLHKSADNNSEESSSSPSELKSDKHRSKLASFHQSDSDDVSLSAAVARALDHKNSLRMKSSIHGLLRGVSHSLESDSVNEHSPASRPSMRRKRKLKRISIDETPIPPTGKRKRSQRMDLGGDTSRGYRSIRIKPLHQSVVDKIEKFCQPNATDEDNMDTQDDNCEIASESSISWSGGEGHEGDDELTDWAPSMDSNTVDQGPWSEDAREIRAGCRRVLDERPGFSISTGANERVAKFLQDSTKCELRLFGVEKEKLGQLAALYSLDLWFEAAGTTLLRKTSKTPYMQPSAQRHHSGHSSHYKRIRTHKTGGIP